MKVEGRVGAISAATGSVNPLRTDERGALAVTQAGGKLSDAAIAGRLFSICNQDQVTTTAALATTWTGLGVGNPATSGKLYVFHEFAWTQNTVMNTEGTVGLMIATVGDMAQSLIPVCARYGYALSSALVDAAATPGTPILARVFGYSMEGAISTVPSVQGNVYYINGGIVIPPGYALLTYTHDIQTTSIIFHFVWEEVAVPA